jgi:hypothetical protein
MNTNKKTLMPQSYLQAPIFNIPAITGLSVRSIRLRNHL